MKRFLVVLLAVVVLFTAVIPKEQAKADGLTLAAIAGGAYAIAAVSGLDLGFTQYDGLGVSQWMQNRINSWLAGRTVAEAFGSELIRLNVGKLLIPSAAVAGITSFLSDLKQNQGLQENSQTATVISSGMLNGQTLYPEGDYLDYPLSPYVTGGTPSWGLEITEGLFNTYTLTPYRANGEAITGAVKSYTDSATKTYQPLGYRIEYTGSNSFVRMLCVIRVLQNGSESYIGFYAGISGVNVGSEGQVTAQIPGAYSPPEGLNDLQSWEGTVANAPDTNLDQLLEDIFDQSAAGTLDVSGEVVDTPAEPVPTPAPTAAPGTIDDVIGQLGEMSGTLEGVQEGVGEAVGQLEGINEGVGSISEALEVPSISEAPAFKFDLTTLFPFCIPFDIYRFVTMFSASPVAPHVQIPFNIPALGLQYTFDLDFSSFDGVALVLRSVELIAFCVGLAILTSKVIRW